MAVPTEDVRKAYETISKLKLSCGSFHKTCFHIHTPASYDYQLLDSWDRRRFEEATEAEIFKICLEQHALPSNYILDDVPKQNEVYTNRKEQLAFLLLAKAIINNRIEVAVIADHNTISGYNKLKKAVQNIPGQVHPVVILGVEISCADRNHVVGVFDNNESTINEIRNWLDEHLISVEEGSFETSATVLEFIKAHNGIGYIAHIDTSDITKPEQFSKAFKRKLFSEDVLSIIGLKNRSRKEAICKRISEYRNPHSADLKIVLDNDAHDVDSLSQNCFWIKGKNTGFSMIKEAFEDYDISVAFEEEASPTQYIKGLYIERTDGGFLIGKDGSDFCLLFSSALNCFIGGRGSGKSTVLELLEYTLRQQCRSEDQLDFICAHGTTWLLYVDNGEEYMLKMWMPKKQEPDSSILDCFGQNPTRKYGFKNYSFNCNQIRDYVLRKNHLRVFKISKQANNTEFKNVSSIQEKKTLLNHFFDVRYSVNELVNTASGDQINQFIRDTLFQNTTLSNPVGKVYFKQQSGLKKVLADIQNRLELRKKEVNGVVDRFNAEQEKKLRIVYSQDGIIMPNFKEWLFENDYSPKRWYDQKNITNEDLIDYLCVLYEKSGFFSFLHLLIEGDAKKAIIIENILKYCRKHDQKMIDDDVLELDGQAAEELLVQVFNHLLSNSRIEYLKRYLTDYEAKIEKFSLEFNVNSREGSNGQTMFKPVRVLSLGQKVVAMLSFVLGYSEFAHDYRPLLIDQPEDNLDNQYIYQNLVKQLRAIKEKRQVIVATHNATIVTNAKADQVCVMDSDNQHGWVAATGYPGENKIKKHIINHLEGGIPSFIHKKNIYDVVLRGKDK